MENRNGNTIGVFQIINKRRGVFTKEDALFLEAFSDHASLAIENSRLVQASLENERVKKELHIAANIQQRLIPKVLPLIPGYEIVAEAVPCKEIGGDFYDVLQLKEHLFAAVIADVSGKGIPAALLVSTLHASLRAYIQTDTNLATLVAKLNSTVYHNSTPESFITFFIMLLDTQKHEITYMNAGHNSPLHLHTRTGLISELGAEMMPLGMLDEASGKVNSVHVEPQDELVLYTDGVTEAMNSEQVPFGDDKFRTIIQSGSDLPIAAKQTQILKEVHTYVGEEAASDDLTIMMVRRVCL